MNKILQSFFGLCALFVATFAQADLTLNMLPYNGASSEKLKTQLGQSISKYGSDHSLVSKDYPYSPAENDKLSFAIDFDFEAANNKNKSAETYYTLSVFGHDYILGLGAFNPLLTAEPHCKPNDSALPTGHCEHIAIWQQTCHLFIFDAKSLNLESVTPLNIARDDRAMPGQKKRSYWYYDEKHPNDPRQIEGWPRCKSLLAVAPAKEVPDALLFTLGYSDSAEPTSKHEEDYHPEFKTTVLTRFSADASGKLQVTQDDKCLGNPNMYSTIASARKALKHCAAK